MGEDAFQYDNRAVYHNTEVDGAEAHQIGSDIEDAHHDKGEQHSEWDDGCDDQSGTYISEEEDKNQKDDDCSFNQIVDNG